MQLAQFHPLYFILPQHLKHLLVLPIVLLSSLPPPPGRRAAWLPDCPAAAPSTDGYGMAPLHAAAQMGCLGCLKWMIDDQGMEPDLRDADKATPLHFAASRGHGKAVRFLLKRGAKVVGDKHGKTPYHDAESNGQSEILHLLEEYSSNSSCRETTTSEEASYEDEEEEIEECTCEVNTRVMDTHHESHSEN